MASTDYSHSWEDFQEILAEAGRRGFAQRHFPCFVETGTFLGQTVIPIAHHFREVHTIETKAECFEAAKLFSWKAKGPIHFHRGFSEDVLPVVVCRLKWPAIFYLDAHYSGGISGGEKTEVPLLQELQVISRTYKSNPAVVVVDDLDLFGRIHHFDGADSCAADWTGITEEALRARFHPERLACSFAMPEKNCYVLCLQQVISPPEPPLGLQIQAAKGCSSTAQMHWLSEPGRPLDMEAVVALRSCGPGWDDVANLVAMEYSNARLTGRAGSPGGGRAQKPGAGGLGPAAAACAAAGTWNRWTSDEAQPFPPTALQPPPSTRPLRGAAENPGGRKPKVLLTRQQAMDMQRELAERFSDADFQRRLRKAWNAAEGNSLKQMEARMEICLPVQTSVIAKYGFDPSRQGVAQSVYSVRALFIEDTEMMELATHLSFLVDPTQH